MTTNESTEGSAIPEAPIEIGTSPETTAQQWALFLHLSLLAGYIVPIAGYVVPLLIWQLKKDEFPSLDAHGKVVTNWMISKLIYLLICIPLFFILVGIPLMLLVACLGLIFPIVGGIKANNGELWPYPLSIPFFK